MYLSSNTLPYPVIPWTLINETTGLIYLLSFAKTNQDVEDALYNNFYTLQDESGINLDDEAVAYLTIQNLQTVFANTNNGMVTILMDKVFKGSQIGGANSV